NVRKQLGLCAAAMAGVAAVSGEAKAVLVTTNENTVLPVPQTLAGVYLNFITGATGTSGASTAGWDFNPYNTASGLGIYWNPATVGGLRGAGVATAPASVVYADLAPGSVIDATSPFTSSIQGTSLNYRNTGSKFLGVRFVNEGTGAMNFGYVKIDTTATTGFPATINGWVYDDSGAGVTIPPIPEPSTGLLALAGGALAVRRWRGKAA
ncbi:MAG TPA: hypothetical protein PLD59_03540, partial [Tepidisphaeraceae bacterium]|nr:hypothetical protein [Tepidisphaeraceae bacterium]